MEVAKKRKVIIFGPPASGKGTRCEKIVESFGLVHISTGDMLRAAVKAKTEAGLKAAELMQAGKLVSDDVIIAMVKDRLDQADCKERGWLLDGFPRTQAQAAALKDAGIEADLFLLLKVEDALVIQRACGRYMDPETGKIYHMTFNPPPEEIKSRLTQRADDTEETMVKRLETFRSHLNSVLGMYTNILVEVDANKDVIENMVQIKQVMG